MTMTPETREELARAIAEAGLWPGSWSRMPEAERNISRHAADALAPIIERLVAERVAAETERCAGIARGFDAPHLNGVGERISAAIRQETSG